MSRACESRECRRNRIPAREPAAFRAGMRGTLRLGDRNVPV